jgi:phosphatidylinositol glycan class A protein
LQVLQTTLSTVGAAICVSHACHDNLILRARLDPSRIHVIPNAVDPSKFTPDPSKRSSDRYVANLDTSCPCHVWDDLSFTFCPPAPTLSITVVVISRLVYRKGVDLLVGIIPKICRALPHVDFLIGGDGNKLLDLQEMVERERLQDRVEFLGAVPHVNVRNFLVQGHIFLNCSLTESFCIAILEAASCGLLVVSTNVGGVPEVLPPDMNILADPQVDALVEGVKQAVERQESKNAVDPFEAHQRIETMYSWHRVAKQTTQVYDKICQQERKSFFGRLACYQSLGGIAGLVACMWAVYVEGWIQVVLRLQPKEKIDVVPDLAPFGRELKKHKAT